MTLTFSSSFGLISGLAVADGGCEEVTTMLLSGTRAIYANQSFTEPAITCSCLWFFLCLKNQRNFYLEIRSQKQMAFCILQIFLNFNFLKSVNLILKFSLKNQKF